MYSKTFKSSTQANDNRTLSVEKLYGEPRLTISDEKRMGFLLDPSDAPALALAILEAAGIDDVDSGNTSCAVADLRTFIARQERITAEAREQAELEAEARDFYDAYHPAADWPYQDWVMLEDRYKAQFLAVARKAREMRAEK